MTTEGPILSVKGLTTQFRTAEGIVKAVDGVSFDLKRGETLGIVGESGSGKSVLGLSLMRLVPRPGEIAGGEILFGDRDTLSTTPEEMRKLRGRRISMIFQDPMTSLNPYMSIAAQMGEVTRLHFGHPKNEALGHAVEMLEAVGIADASERIHAYPHEFSGGMRQRVVIAMALSCGPEVLIADEPTTALDVTIQAQILELIQDLSERLGTSVILITHDLGVVAGIAEKVIVMYAGRVFEQAGTRELFAAPANPYTVGLLKSVPDPGRETTAELYQIPGLPPDLMELPPGCPFAERCERAEDICRVEAPPFVEVAAGHFSLCHFAEEVYASSIRSAAVVAG